MLSCYTYQLVLNMNVSVALYIVAKYIYNILNNLYYSYIYIYTSLFVRRMRSLVVTGLLLLEPGFSDLLEEFGHLSVKFVPSLLQAREHVIEVVELAVQLNVLCPENQRNSLTVIRVYFNGQRTLRGHC